MNRYININAIGVQFSVLLLVTITALILLITGFNTEAERFKRFLIMNAGIVQCISIMEDINDVARKIVHDHKEYKQSDIDKLFTEYRRTADRIIPIQIEAYTYVEQPYTSTADIIGQMRSLIDEINRLVQQYDKNEDNITSQILDLENYLLSLKASTELNVLKKEIAVFGAIYFLRYSKLVVAGTETPLIKDYNTLYDNTVDLFESNLNFKAPNLSEEELKNIHSRLASILSLIKYHKTIALTLKNDPVAMSGEPGVEDKFYKIREDFKNVIADRNRVISLVVSKVSLQNAYAVSFVSILLLIISFFVISRKILGNILGIKTEFEKFEYNGHFLLNLKIDDSKKDDFKVLRISINKIIYSLKITMYKIVTECANMSMSLASTNLRLFEVYAIVHKQAVVIELLSNVTKDMNSIVSKISDDISKTAGEARQIITLTNELHTIINEVTNEVASDNKEKVQNKFKEIQTEINNLVTDISIVAADSAKQSSINTREIESVKNIGGLDKASIHKVNELFKTMVTLQKSVNVINKNINKIKVSDIDEFIKMKLVKSNKIADLVNALIKNESLNTPANYREAGLGSIYYSEKLWSLFGSNPTFTKIDEHHRAIFASLNSIEQARNNDELVELIPYIENIHKNLESIQTLIDTMEDENYKTIIKTHQFYHEDIHN